MKKMCLVLFAFLLFVSVSRAVEWDLEECVAYALKNNVDVKNSEREMTMAKSALRAAYGGMLPSVDVSALKVLNESVSEMEIMGTTIETDLLNDYQYQISATQVLFAGGGVFFNIKNSLKEKEIASINYEKEVSRVVYDISEAYYTLVYADLMRDLTYESIDILEKQLSMVRAQYESGEAAYLDLLQAKTELNNMTPERIKADSMAKVSLMSLKNLMGFGEDTDVHISGSYRTDDDLAEMDRDSLLSNAMRNNHDLRILNCNEKILKNTAVMARGTYLPSLVLSGSYGQGKENWGDDWAESYNISLALSWNIFDGFRRENNMTEIKYGRYILEDTISDLKRKLSMDIDMKIETVRESYERMIAGDTGLTLGEETLKMAQSAYEEGMISLLELMQARIGYNSAKASRIRAEYDYSLSILNLKKTLGVLAGKEEI